jgi:hypothetical protein
VIKRLALIAAAMFAAGSSSAAIDADGRWMAGIGDPSPMGWITVAAYGAAAALAARNAFAARRSAAPVGFWLTLTLVMLLLGINKQLDLQTWFGQTGRDIALSQGWYGRRRTVQAMFIVLLGAGAIAFVAAARRYWVARWHEYRWVFLGVVLLAVFIVIRAASFHHIDEFIHFDIGKTTLGRALEIIGVIVIGAACTQWHAAQRRVFSGLSRNRA